MDVEEQPWSRRELAFVVAVTAIAAALRLFALGEKSLWFDESLFFWASQADADQLVALNKSVRASPPAYTFLIHYWSAWGDSERWLRLPAALAGIAAVPLVHAAARRFVPVAAALFAALLVATSTNHVEMSQRVSEYGFATLVAAALVHAFARYRSRPEASRAAWLGALAIISPLIHYGIALLAGGLFAAFLLETFRDRDTNPPPRSLAFVGVALAGAAVFAWFWLDVGAILMQSQGPGSGGYLWRGYWDGSLLSFARLSVGNTLGIFDFVHAGGAIALVLTAVALLTHSVRPGDRWAVHALLFTLGATFVAALAGLYPYVGKRHVFFALPLICVVAAVGFARIQQLEPEAVRRALVAAIVGLVIIAGLFDVGRLLRSDGPEDMRPVVERLLAERETGDAVFLYSATAPSAHYYLSRDDPRLRAELASRVDEWLPWMRPLRLDPAEPLPVEGVPVHFTDCPEGNCALRPTLSDELLPHELARLDADLRSAKRTWMLLAHCRLEDCEALRRHAARCGTTELVAEAADVSLYRAEAAPTCTDPSSFRYVDPKGEADLVTATP